MTSCKCCDIIILVAETRRATKYGGIAQLARALGSYPGCRWFESDCRYHFGPLVKRLRHRPFTAESWVRFPYGSPSNHLPNGLIKPFGRFRFMCENEIVRCLSAILFFQRTNLFYLSALCLFLRKSKALSMASETRACAVSNWCE